MSDSKAVMSDIKALDFLLLHIWDSRESLLSFDLILQSFQTSPAKA